VVVCDLDKEKRFSGPQLLHDHQIASGISVIIGPRDDPWGLLSVHSRVPIDYTLDDAHFATAVANVLGDAIRRRDIESQLRDSEARTAAFLNNSAVVCWMKDEQGRYVYLNENYQKRFHVRLEDWRDKTDWEVWPADVAEGLRSNDRKCLESGKPLEVIEEVVDAAGKSSHFLTAKFPFIDAGGNRYVGGLGVDVTATVEAEEALAKSEEHLRTAAAMAGFGTYFGDLDTGELTWSAELKSIFGLAPDAPTPCGIGEVPELVYPGDRARVLEKVRASLDPAGNGDFHDEHRIVRPDGEVRWLLLQGRTIFQEDARGRRRPIKIAGIGQDITERHQFEAELEHARQSAEAANRAKSMFLANVSHEIRSPMTAILGYAEILQSQLEDEDARRCLKTIRDSGTYLCDILDDILDLAKIEAGKTTVNREAVDTAEMLADVRSLMSVRALEKDLALTVRFIGQVPATIRTDRQRVRQVLVNLIGNAIKFTERGSVEITMTCHAADELLEIAVIDSGVGIEADQIDLLFQPFERLEGAAANNVGGSGLGLSISKKLLEMLGGQITASSVPGEGSTFRFTLPTGPLDDVRWISPAPDALREERGEVTPEQLPQLHARVLAVDDRPEIRFLLRHFSERAGADVKTAENGLEALEVFRSCRDANAPPDVILMDMQMPEMDGMEATRRLRDEGYQGPIIAITASAMESDRQKCLQTGCNDFLSKPVERAELIRKLASWSGKGSNQ
jgi:PAS domain S-box-containing protein